MAIRKRRVVLWILFSLALYVGLYATLSLTGDYKVRPSGERRWMHGLAVMDSALWTPRWMRWERRKQIDGTYILDGDLPGWVFLPLIQLDRKFVHPTRNLFND